MAAQFDGTSKTDLNRPEGRFTPQPNGSLLIHGDCNSSTLPNTTQKSSTKGRGGGYKGQ